MLTLLVPLGVCCAGLSSVPGWGWLNTTRGRWRIEALELDDNDITHIPPDAFDGLQELGVCIRTMWLDGNHITALDAGAFRSVPWLELLYVVKNEIARVDAEAFAGLPDLYELHLENNRITELTPGTFKDCPNLGILHLTRNDLGKLSAGAFLGPTYMETLMLDSNRIGADDGHGHGGLEPGCFGTLTHVEATLSLASNQISALHSGAVDTIVVQGKLDLSFNRIEHIAPNNTGFFEELTELDLSNNALTRLRSGMLAHAGARLKTVRVAANYISELYSGSFAYAQGRASEVTLLDLTANQLASIHPRAFAALSNLVFLALRYNKLSEITHSSFAALANLKTLSLDDNLITAIQASSFARLASLTALYIDKNPLSCHAQPVLAAASGTANGTANGTSSGGGTAGSTTRLNMASFGTWASARCSCPSDSEQNAAGKRTVAYHPPTSPAGTAACLPKQLELVFAEPRARARTGPGMTDYDSAATQYVVGRTYRIAPPKLDLHRTVVSLGTASGLTYRLLGAHDGFFVNSETGELFGEFKHVGNYSMDLAASKWAEPQEWAFLLTSSACLHVRPCAWGCIVRAGKQTKSNWPPLID